jgi:hypothetical protein
VKSIGLTSLDKPLLWPGSVSRDRGIDRQTKPLKERGDFVGWRTDGRIFFDCVTFSDSPDRAAGFP